MSGDRRYVFDTNVLVSAVLFEHGKPGQAFRQALHHGEILISLPLLDELTEVLGRKKFERYVKVEEREEFLRALVARAALIEPKEIIRVCRDPKDDMLLELAVAGGAAYLLTGDQDLLALNPFRDIAIVTADQFLALTAEDFTE
jgi:putative PIN family toxin of toxin-antitoxin system